MRFCSADRQMQRTFTAESLDAKVYFQLLSLERQLFVWADVGSKRLSAVVLAGTSPPVRPSTPLPGLAPLHAPPAVAKHRLSVSAQRRDARRAACRRRLTSYLAARARGVGAWHAASVWPVMRILCSYFACVIPYI